MCKMGQSLNIITAPVPMSKLACVCKREREAVMNLCVKSRKVSTVACEYKNCICVTV